MNIKSVRIEGMHNVAVKEYQFNSINYITGPNGAGKSTILEAIQLCLLGYVPGTNKTKSAIFAHSNGNRLSIELILDDNGKDVIVNRTFTRNRSSVDETIDIRPSSYELEAIVGESNLPILNFNEFLGMTANKQKEFLTSIIPLGETNIDVKSFLEGDSTYSNKCQGLIDEVLDECETLTNIEEVKELNAYLKELQSRLTAEEKRLTSTAQSLIFYDDYEGSDDVEQLKTQINELMLLRDRVLKSESLKANRASYLARLEEFADLSESIDADSRLLELEEKKASLQASISESQDISDEKSTEIAILDAQISQLSEIVKSEGICPFTKEKCLEVSSKLDSMSFELKEILDTRNKLSEFIQNESDNRIKLHEDLTQIFSEIDSRVKKYQDRESINSALATDIEEFEESSQDLSIKLQSLNDDLMKASANAKYQELMEEIQTQKLELESQVDFIKSVVKKTGENGLQTQLAAKPFEILKNSMNQTLSDLGLNNLGTVEFNLEEKANSFNFGFVRTALIPFELLSSGEKCIFTLVFMLNLAKIANSSLQFLMIDDLFDHLDENRFKTVISNINKLNSSDRPIQIILAGVNEINDADVNVIYVGDRDD